MQNTATPATEPDTLNARQERFLSALLTENSTSAAAKHANCATRTAHLWLKQPEFQAAYRQARRDGVARATSRLQAVSVDAVDALRSIVGNTEAPAYARVAAARVILDSALRAQEIEELDARIETLEQTLEARDAAAEAQEAQL